MTRNPVPVVLLVLVCALVLAAGCTGRPGEKTTVNVVAAGSLLVPLGEADARYEALHPDIDIQVEGHGSIQAIRQVTDIHRSFDLVMVADESLIPDLMYRPVEGGEGNYTDWYIPFARNEMVIAFTDKSRYHDEITHENWHRILARPDVRVGFSNPMKDAAGYRALIVTLLAGEFYDDPAIFSRVIGDHFNPALEARPEDGVLTVRLPQVLKPDTRKIAIRDGSIFLMSLLEAGGIDYAFEYRNVAEAWGVPYVVLPDAINLADDLQAEQYATVKVILGFPRFATIGSERPGMPIVYAVTIPSTAERPDEGRAFMEFFLAEVERGGKGWPAPLDTPPGSQGMTGAGGPDR